MSKMLGLYYDNVGEKTGFLEELGVEAVFCKC
jgi:hypothetical protein